MVLWDVLLYEFCIKVLRGETRPHECEFFIELAKHADLGVGTSMHSNEEWRAMISEVEAAMRK